MNQLRVMPERNIWGVIRRWTVSVHVGDDQWVKLASSWQRSNVLDAVVSEQKWRSRFGPVPLWVRARLGDS